MYLCCFLCLHFQDAEEIVTSPPGSQLLAETIDRDGQETEKYSKATKYIHDLSWTAFKGPVVDKITEPVKNEVLTRVSCGNLVPGGRRFTLNNMAMMNISLDSSRKASSAYAEAADTAMTTPHCMMPQTKAFSGPAAPVCIVYPKRNAPRA